MFIVFFIVLPVVITLIWGVSRRNTVEIPHSGSENTSAIADSGEESSFANDPGDESNSSEPEGGFGTEQSNETEEVSFLYIPAGFAGFTDDIDKKIREFLESSLNKDDSKLAVEIPHLPDDDAIILTSAITDLFEKHGVSLSRIVFFIYNPEDNVTEHEIFISYQ